MAPNSTAFRRAVLLAVLTFAVWRAATLPVTAAEAALWNRVVRPPVRELLVTPGDWSGFVYGLIARRAAGLFRLSAFSLRFPAVLGCILYMGALGRLCRDRIWLLAVLAVAPLFLGCFTLAGGAGLALGLTALGLAFPAGAGWWLGLALAAGPQIGFVPLTAALAFWKGIGRVAIPAVAIGFVSLIFPLSHGGAPLPLPDRPTPTDAAMRSAMQVLAAEAGKSPIRISPSPAAADFVAFYRASGRHRAWTVTGAEANYFVWLVPDTPPSGAVHRVLCQSDGVVLAQ
jgi:hypothetical protein